MVTPYEQLRTPAMALGMASALPAGYPAWRVKSAIARRIIASGIIGALFVLCLSAGLWQFGQGAYIHVKARFAQYLIADAWHKTLAGQRAVKPWPWADTWPVARLQAPATSQSLYVLAGANGRTIAFGPGHMYGTPLPGAAGNSVIGGHRDTHFAFLRELKPSDALNVQREDGQWRRYQVSETKVVDKSDVYVARSTGTTRLTLITCWPFDALRAGGAQRYVVTALAYDNPP